MDGPTEIRERQISYDITFAECKKMIQMNLFTKQSRVMDIENKLMVMGGGATWHIHITIYKTDKQGPTI